MITLSPSIRTDGRASSLQLFQQVGVEARQRQRRVENSSVSGHPSDAVDLALDHQVFRLTVARSMFFEAPKTSLMILNT